VVLIFSNYTRFDEYLDEDRRFKMEVPSVMLHTGSITYSLYDINDDTISYSILDEYALVEVRMNEMEMMGTLIKRNDTLLINFSDGNPNLEIPNRETLAFDVNYNLQFNGKKISSQRYSAFSLDPFFEWIKGSGISLNYPVYTFIETEDQLHQECLKQFEIENSFLDSLLNTNSISKLNYKLYKDNLNYNLLIHMINRDRVEYEELKSIIQQNDLNNDPFPNAVYRRFLRRFIVKYYMPMTRLIKYSNGSTYDYRELYETIRNDSLFTGKYQNDLLLTQLELIAENFSVSDFQKYFVMFEEDVQDTTLINSIKDKYILDFDELRLESQGLHLIDLAKKKYTLDEMINQSKGKVIYIDFWASWCAPCRKAMPASHLLKKEYQKKNMVFFYLSSDKNFDRWETATKEENLSFEDNNYLMVNSETSEYLKTLKFQSIPRYLIFDKQGNLVHHNAPGPDSDEIRKLFDKYLGEKID
jgi:thiol-disulfide isomerase/thioredoxin